MIKKSIIPKNVLAALVVPTLLVIIATGVLLFFLNKDIEKNSDLKMKDENLVKAVKEMQEIYVNVEFLELKLLAEEIDSEELKTLIENKNTTTKKTGKILEELKKNGSNHELRANISKILKLYSEDKKAFDEYFSTAEIYHTTKDITTYDIMKNIAMKSDKEKIDIRISDMKELINQFDVLKSKNKAKDEMRIKIYMAGIMLLFVGIIVIFLVYIKALLKLNRNENKSLIVNVLGNNRIEIVEGNNEFEIMNSSIKKYKEEVKNTLVSLKSKIDKIKNMNRDALLSIVTIVNEAEKNEKEIEEKNVMLHDAENGYQYEEKDRDVLSSFSGKMMSCIDNGKNRLENGKRILNKIKNVTLESRDSINKVGEYFKYIEETIGEIDELSVYANHITLTVAIEDGKTNETNNGINAVVQQAKKLSDRMSAELKEFKNKVKEMKVKERDANDKMTDSADIMNSLVVEWGKIEENNTAIIENAEMFLKQSFEVDEIIKTKEKKYCDIYREKIEVLSNNKKIIDDLENHYEMIKNCHNESEIVEESIIIPKFD